LKEFQEKPQDQSVLPSLSLSDISRNIEFVDHETSYIMNKVKCRWYDQPTNGISYVRIKANLKNLPEKYRIFVPLFKELLSNIGTKNYRYDVFNDKMMNSTTGLEVSIDKYAYSEDHMDIFDRNEQILLQTGFLDRNTDEAFECLAEILATPNFDEPDNLSDLIRMESVNKAQNMGNRGLEYGRSYANGGLKAFAKSYEELNSDIFFCQFAQELLSTSNPHLILKDATINLTDIASYIFREENIEIAIHGNKSKFNLIQMKLELLLNQMRNENSRYSEKHPNIERLKQEFVSPVYH